MVSLTFPPGPANPFDCGFRCAERVCTRSSSCRGQGWHFRPLSTRSPGGEVADPPKGAVPLFSIWYHTTWSFTVKELIDGLVYALLTAGVFGWLWP